MSTAAQEQHRAALTVAYPRAGLTLQQLWEDYFALGGDAGVLEIDAYLHGLMPLPALQRDMLAQAVNERLKPTLSHRVPYSRPLPQVETAAGPSAPAGSPRAGGPLSALVTLLIGAHLTPPGRLPSLAAAAGDALGVRVVMYLVDYDQLRLLPIPTEGSAAREPLSVDGTLAGRAFQLVQTIPSAADGRPRLWIPLLDGVERLGVLDVSLAADADLNDSALAAQCFWLAKLLGHLITVTGAYGDALDRVRRQQPRTAAAEIIWGLLPPLTAGTDVFTIAGLLEPTYAIGGDAFDYNLAETSASLAIFDAMGHSLGAALISTAALGGYRSARNRRADLPGQTATIDKAVSSEFADGFLTGVLADLDLTTGLLRYINAGHPYPLLLRDGRVVKTLRGGRRTPLGMGLETGELAVGQETLQPGDWLIFYTDGITEARDRTGEFFGDTRLVDFLGRGAAAGLPPSETVRRLVQAVIDHQNGILQDDATILLARWENRCAGETR